MRIAALSIALALAACAGQTPRTTTTTNLAAADAATTLIAGEAIAMTRTAYEAPADSGQDPTILLSFRHADGRIMSFGELNHAPGHVMAQAPGGPLAQTMGLFGEERPLLYGARNEEHRGAPFICGPEGPATIGYYETADGAVQIIGLRQQFSFETLPDGTSAALPYSPDQVCARLSFRRY